jgi:hypothetical protein
MEIPNDKLQGLRQAVIDKNIFPSKWLAVLVAGILKGRKDPTKSASIGVLSPEILDATH